MSEIDHSFIALQNALLGRYSIERELGRGGMGIVYLARDVQLDRPVAIKVLHDALAGDAGARDRFVEEARTAARLSHPHIVPIYAVEARGDFVFFVMALIDGETLGQRIRRRGPLAADDAERMMREVAWALGYAHAHGVVHRDLTPENILLERHTGRALLADFGIATSHDTTDAAPMFGTPGYLAPEVIRGEPASPASDLYGLGVVGFTALAGAAPFRGDTTAQLLARHLMQPAPPLPASVRVSRRLRDAIAACLAKDPDARPASAAAWHAMLTRTAEPVTIAPPLHNWFARWGRIRPVYALAAPVLAAQTWLLIQGYFHSGVRMLLTAALIGTAATLTAIPLVMQLVFEAIELRRLRQSGYGVDDIRAAFPHWQAEAVRQRRDEGMAPLPGRVISDLTMVGAAAIALTFLVIWPNLHVSATELPYVRTALIGILSPVYLGTLTGVGIGFLVPGHRASPTGLLARLKQRFWNSRFARLIVTLSSLGQRHRLIATATLHRNTEMVLGLAVDDLWQAVTADTRAELGDVPALAHTLQAGAVELRELIDRLRDSERTLRDDDPMLADLAAAREPLEQQHRRTVAALERVRLQLLRLLASHHHTADLTAELVAARAVESDLATQAAAHGAVRRMLRRPAAAFTPIATPTPA
jgi:serine/threonine-protein kinase